MRRHPRVWLRRTVALGIVLVLGLLGAAPAIAAAAAAVDLTIAGITSGTVTLTDTTTGAVYSSTYDGVSGTWDATVGSGTDAFLLQVTQTVYQNTYASLITPTNGTVSGSTYLLTTPVTLPTQVPTAGTVTFSSVTSSGATVTATVYASTYTNPVANAGLYVTTSTTGASLAATSNGVTVSGSVYGSTDSSGTLVTTLTGSAGSTVAVAVYYDGTQVATGQTTLLGTSGSSSSSSSSGGGNSSGASIGSGGGTLTTPDAAFQMVIPAGALPSGATLSVTSAQAPPSGAPQAPLANAATPYYTLTGLALGHPVAAQIQYNPNWLSGLSPDRLAVYELVGGKWTYLPTAVDAAKGTVSAYVGGPATIVVLYSTTQFSDESAGFWAMPAVDTLLGAQVVSGYPDGTFRPAASVTRAEFVKMLVLSMGLTPGGTASNFDDVAAGDWFAPYIAAAVQAGLVQGVGPAAFAPDATLTRDQMAVLLARALKLQGTATLTFSDATQVDLWAQSALAADVAAGLLSGYPNGTFQPQASSSRAESAQVLAGLIHHLAP
ncbi:MAG TPA: S-layer homology domain-containing protein [Bacillota bacterium]|nr:S-layer homology domain-containing protein [Bacillota bacterium]